MGVLHKSAQAEPVVRNGRSDVGKMKKPYCWQNETQERAAGGLFRAFGGMLH